LAREAPVNRARPRARLIQVRDGLGKVETRLRPRSEVVGSTSPASPLEIAYWTITLDPGEGPAPGFKLNSVRTRGLEFKRART